MKAKVQPGISDTKFLEKKYLFYFICYVPTWQPKEQHADIRKATRGHEGLKIPNPTNRWRARHSMDEVNMISFETGKGWISRRYGFGKKEVIVLDSLSDYT
jgi:hypothetical protein